MQLVQDQYECVKVLKEREGSCVQLLRLKETGQRVVFRRFLGDAAVYHKLRQVTCPNLPQILQVEERCGWVFVMEEYIQGDSLDVLLEGCLMTPREAAAIGVQICKALEVLHGIEAIHRDVKPSNIVLHGDRAVLIDFDAARIHKQTQSGDTRVMGTTGYAAPEQYGLGQTDARADIYAMGVLLNVMVTGRHPSQALAEGWLRPIIQTCIQVNADRRYPSARALAAALTMKKRKRWPWALGAAALLLVCCALGYGMTRKEPAAEAIQDTPQEEQAEELTVEEPLGEETGPLQMVGSTAQPVGGTQQFNLLLNGQLLTAADVEYIGLDKEELGVISSTESEIEAGWREPSNLSRGHWLWCSDTAYPEVEGTMLVTVGGERYELAVCTESATGRFYTEELDFIPRSVEPQILYDPGSPTAVEFEILNTAAGSITSAYCENNENIICEVDAGAQTARFRLAEGTVGTQYARLVVEADGTNGFWVAVVEFVPSTLMGSVNMRNLRMPGTMQFDLLLDGQAVDVERITSLEFSDPALGEIISLTELIEQRQWPHGTEWGWWLWDTGTAMPHTEGTLTAVIDGVAYTMEVSTGSPDCGFYTSGDFSDEAFLPFGQTKLFYYEPGEDLTVWFTNFDGETILRAYSSREEFLTELPEEPTGTVAFTLNPALTGDHNLQLTVVTSNGVYHRVAVSLLEKTE